MAIYSFEFQRNSTASQWPRLGSVNLYLPNVCVKMLYPR